MIAVNFSSFPIGKGCHCALIMAFIVIFYLRRGRRANFSLKSAIDFIGGQVVFIILKDVVFFGSGLFGLIDGFRVALPILRLVTYMGKGNVSIVFIVPMFQRGNACGLFTLVSLYLC